MLSNSPGNIGFEAAPFKLTFDYIEVMGGVDSPMFQEFKRLFHDGFETVRKHCDRIVGKYSYLLYQAHVAHPLCASHRRVDAER